MNYATIKDRSETIKFPHNRILIVFAFGSFPDALLADLQNTVPGAHLNPVNGAANGTSGYGCLKGARRKEPQVSLVTDFDDDSPSYVHHHRAFHLSREKSTYLISLVCLVDCVFVIFAHVTATKTFSLKILL